MNVALFPAPLLAIDLESLLPFLFVVYWIVSQIFGAFRRGRQAPGPVPGPRPPRLDPVAGPRPPANADDPQADIARQIEAFLRQAAGEPPRRADDVGRPGNAAPRPAGASRPQGPSRSPPPSRPQPPAPVAGQRRPSTLSPRERDEALRPRQGQAQDGTRRVDARSPRDRSEQAATTEATRPGAKKPRPAKPPAAAAARSPSLTRLDGGDGAGESVERHVNEAFGRELPHLAAAQGGSSALPPVEAVPARPSMADDLVRKLRDPASIRELIVLREVLDRPVSRW